MKKNQNKKTHKPKAKRTKKPSKPVEFNALEALLSTQQDDKKIKYERTHKGVKQIKYYVSAYNPIARRNTMQFRWFTDTLEN